MEIVVIIDGREEELKAWRRCRMAIEETDSAPKFTQITQAMGFILPGGGHHSQIQLLFCS